MSPGFPWVVRTRLQRICHIQHSYFIFPNELHPSSLQASNSCTTICITLFHRLVAIESLRIVEGAVKFSDSNFGIWTSTAYYASASCCRQRGLGPLDRFQANRWGARSTQTGVRGFVVA